MPRDRCRDSLNKTITLPHPKLARYGCASKAIGPTGFGTISSTATSNPLIPTPRGSGGKFVPKVKGFPRKTKINSSAEIGWLTGGHREG